MLISELFVDVTDKYSKISSSTIVPNIPTIYRDKNNKLVFSFSTGRPFINDTILLLPLFYPAKSRQKILTRLINNELNKQDYSHSEIMNIQIFGDFFRIPVRLKLYAIPPIELAYFRRDINLNRVIDSRDDEKELSSLFNIKKGHGKRENNGVSSTILDLFSVVKNIGVDSDVNSVSILDKYIFIDVLTHNVSLIKYADKIDLAVGQYLLSPSSTTTQEDFALIYIYIATLIYRYSKSKWVEEMINKDSLTIYYPYSEHNLLDSLIIYFTGKEVQDNED